MPLYQSITIDSTSQILVWEITESFEQLFKEIQLTQKSLMRLKGMKSELHQRAFLSVRKLLREAGYSDFDLFYDGWGKPHLIDKKFISISHSHQFSTIIISNQKVGIDIEMIRDKILRIANKFVNDNELTRLQNFDNQDYVKKLTVKWGAKEAIFKIRNEKGISFKDHIRVFPFDMKAKKTTAILDFENSKQLFFIFFEEIKGYILVYALRV